MRLKDCHNFKDFRRLAQKRLPSPIFDYIDGGARASARRMIGLVQSWLNAQSVLDLGCGRGAWLKRWPGRSRSTGAVRAR